MEFRLFITIGTAVCLATSGFSQEKFNIAESINKFSVDLLEEVNRLGGQNINIALSPLTIWTMLTAISEGSFDSTADQLDKALRQPQNKNIVKDSYMRLHNLMKQTLSNSTEFETSTGVFSRTDFPVKDKYARIVKQYYEATITPADFKNDHQGAAEAINKYVAQATHNRIPTLVKPADVENAYLFITSTMYFKGKWRVPFNRTETEATPFLDESRNTVGQVQMMNKMYPFPYSRIDKIKADALELPYGDEDAYSMLILVPRGAQTVSNMLAGLKGESVTDILARVKQNHQTFPEDDINVYIPRFKINSEFNMDQTLKNMGITDLFDPQKANLLGIFNHYLFLSRVIQKAEIETDEEGTVASAAAGSIFMNRIPPPTVKANRPFVFFIVHKKSGTIIFSGKVSNPNTLG